MKGVILHGGTGTRLRPLTYTDVKQLLPVAGKPVSEYALLNLIEIGINEINIVVGDIGRTEVQRYYGDGSNWGVHISYTFQEKPLGIAHAIGITKDFIKDDRFVVILGDNYFQGGLKQLSQTFHTKHFDTLVALTKVNNPSQFGIAEIKNENIISLTEKPKNPKSDLAITGAYFLSPKIFPIIDGLEPSARGELEITEAFQIMLTKGMNVGYSIISGWWKDTGTVDEFLDCNRMVLEKLEPRIPSKFRMENVIITGRVHIGSNVVLRGIVKISGPCYIGNNSVIEDTSIGSYTSIGSDCSLKNLDIEDSVVMDGSNIEMSTGIAISESLIGSKVSISPSNSKSKRIRLVIGRDSKIEL